MSQTKSSHLALDYLPAQDHLQETTNNKKLPDGITQSMLLKDVFKIAGPSFIELTLTQLTSMADMMMVGQLGAWAITAVGLTTQPKFLLMTLFQSMNVGATALVARFKGAQDREKANAVLRQSLVLSFILSALMSILGYVFAEPMVIFMGGKDDLMIIQEAVSYLRIQMIGFVFMALTTTITAALRGVGDSKTAMIYNVVANVVNVCLNYCLIYGNFNMPKMGIAGASLATIIGQLAAFFMASYAILKKGGYLELSFKDSFYPDKVILANIFKIGFPAMIEQLFMRIGNIIYSKTVASLGTVAFATHNVCMNIQAMSFMIGQAFAVSATSLVGQSLGKKRADMAHHYGKTTQWVGVFVSILLGIVFFLFGENIVMLYNNEKEIIEFGGKILMFLAFVQPFQASQFILAGALRGAGDTKTTALVIFITTLLVRPILAIILVYPCNLGLYGAWIALVVDQLIRSFLIWLRYHSGKWMLLKLKGE